MRDEQFDDVIDALNQCVIDCINCEVACHEEENVKELIHCIRLDRECAETCQFTAKMLVADAELSRDILEICARVCDLCAEECEKHGDHMEHCQICAESCRSCAEECRAIVEVNA